MSSEAIRQKNGGSFYKQITFQWISWSYSQNHDSHTQWSGRRLLEGKIVSQQQLTVNFSVSYTLVLIFTATNFRDVYLTFVSFLKFKCFSHHSLYLHGKRTTLSQIPPVRKKESRPNLEWYEDDRISHFGFIDFLDFFDSSWNEVR